MEGIDSNGQAWAAIEGAQPYHASDPCSILFPREDTLWDLVGWNNAAELLEYIVLNQPLSMVRETQILRMRFSKTGPDPQVRVKGNFSIEPTFGDGGIQVPMDNIAWLHPHVSDFVESFK